MLTRRLDFADSAADRIAVLERLARVAEVERDSIDEAIATLHQILDIEPDHAATHQGLERLLGGAQRWHDLVELYQRLAEREADRGRVDEEVRLLAKAADAWEGPLEDPDAAGEVLEKILERRPEFVPALTRLARIYSSQGEWPRAQDVLERALALGPARVATPPTCTSGWARPPATRPRRPGPPTRAPPTRRP